MLAIVTYVPGKQNLNKNQATSFFYPELDSNTFALIEKITNDCACSSLAMMRCVVLYTARGGSRTRMRDEIHARLSLFWVGCGTGISQVMAGVAAVWGGFFEEVKTPLSNGERQYGVANPRLCGLHARQTRALLHYLLGSSGHC